MSEAGRPFYRRRGPVVALLVGIAVLAAGTWAAREVARLDRELVERFAGRRWQIPSKIYSDSYVVNVGAEAPPLAVVERLARLDYRAVGGEVAHGGEYRYDPAARTLDVHTRNFDYPGRFSSGFRARLRFSGSTVESIERLDDGRAIDAVEIEPETIAGIYDRAWEDRRVLDITEIPSVLVRAVLAAEDRRFFEHHGIDFRGVARALVRNVVSGRVVQGGSTLTQQLIKNFFLTGERTLERKVVEAVMALLAEYHYSKLEILESYLNEIYLGQRGSQGVFGVWEGARHYFGKEPRDLSLSESAMLAGLIKSPGRLAPAKNPGPARERRNEVLRALLENGEISLEAYETAVAEPLPERLPSPEPSDVGHFVDYVRSELEGDYPLNTLVSEGFRIFTTLDPSLQREAQRAVERGLAAIDKRLGKHAPAERLEACLLAIEPHTGEIRAMVGGRSYAQSQFNRVTQALRQPGSVFKPFVFLAAFELEEQQGAGQYRATRRIEDAPFTWRYEGREWTPKNANGEYAGEVTLRQALELSLNSATARLAAELGVSRIHELVLRLGFPASLPEVPSLALGAVEVTPFQVAQAFATIANLGFRTEKSAIRAVLDDRGEPIQREGLRAAQAVSPRAAYLVTSLMEGVLERGTARAARGLGLRFPAAGKTGTTNDGRDAWFVGFTPDLLAVVWVGYDRGGGGLSGAQAALPIWVDFMKAATAGRAPTPFLVPPGIEMVTIDPTSGELGTRRCPRKISEAFLAGGGPTADCHLHPDPDAAGRAPGLVPNAGEAP